MTKMLDIIEAFLNVCEYSHLRLDGSTSVSDRQELLNEFNTNNEVFIFLLSTRAGGLGVNLTSADVVIFYDISFNPQVDRQAEDRCHRLGQTKKVTIYKLLVKDSCESHILDMASEKKELNDVMLDEGKYESGLYELDDDVLLRVFTGRVERKRKKRKRENHPKKKQ